MRKFIVLIAMMSAACGDVPSGNNATAGQSDPTGAKAIEQLQKSNDDLREQIAKLKSEGDVTGARTVENRGDNKRDTGGTAGSAEPVNLCWQDYCPCENPATAIDKSLCRNLKSGMPMDRNLMSMGAMQRDTNEQLRQFNRHNPDIAIPISELEDTE